MSVRFRPRPPVIPVKKKRIAKFSTEHKLPTVIVPEPGNVSLESMFEALATRTVERRQKDRPDPALTAQLRNGLASLSRSEKLAAPPVGSRIEEPVVLVYSGTGKIDADGMFSLSYPYSPGSANPSIVKFRAEHWEGMPKTTEEAINRMAETLVALTGRKIL